jgi:hypothetical protein
MVAFLLFCGLFEAPGLWKVYQEKNLQLEKDLLDAPDLHLDSELFTEFLNTDFAQGLPKDLRAHLGLYVQQTEWKVFEVTYLSDAARGSPLYGNLGCQLIMAPQTAHFRLRYQKKCLIDSPRFHMAWFNSSTILGLRGTPGNFDYFVKISSTRSRLEEIYQLGKVQEL